MPQESPHEPAIKKSSANFYLNSIIAQKAATPKPERESSVDSKNRPLCGLRIWSSQIKYPIGLANVFRGNKWNRFSWKPNNIDRYSQRDKTNEETNLNINSRANWYESLVGSKWKSDAWLLNDRRGLLLYYINIIIVSYTCDRVMLKFSRSDDSLVTAFQEHSPSERHLAPPQPHSIVHKKLCTAFSEALKSWNEKSVFSRSWP